MDLSDIHQQDNLEQQFRTIIAKMSKQESPNYLQCTLMILEAHYTSQGYSETSKALKEVRQSMVKKYGLDPME